MLDDVYLGFDPGGDRKFGVALLKGGCVKTSTVSTVDEAMKWAVNACGALKPKAAGIDTLLHWATCKSGTRPCDERLRARYPEARNSIMSPNSLFGAMAIGGMALALRLRQEWPEILLNETHPKVFLHAHEKIYDATDSKTIENTIIWFKSQKSVSEINIVGEHALDAALSAWSTRDGFAEGWADIIGNHEKLLFPAGEVHYLWPQLCETEGSATGQKIRGNHYSLKKEGF
jgi:hypothetical protein